MAAQIPPNIASVLLKELDDLRAKVVPLVERVLHDASTTGTDVTESTVQHVLDELRKRSGALEAKIKEHAPPGV